MDSSVFPATGLAEIFAIRISGQFQSGKPPLPQLRFVRRISRRIWGRRTRRGRRTGRPRRRSRTTKSRACRWTPARWPPTIWTPNSFTTDAPLHLCVIASCDLRVLNKTHSRHANDKFTKTLVLMVILMALLRHISFPIVPHCSTKTTSFS